MTESIKIKFIEKKITYNKLINVLKEELDSNTFLKIKKYWKIMILKNE